MKLKGLLDFFSGAGGILYVLNNFLINICLFSICIIKKPKSLKYKDKLIQIDIKF
ncbi:hypothetical protein G8S49_12940 [Clostridium botulinum C]|uniref:Uncharacterized protein n=1 Tax=Clostridium botulinum C TaxID=36828 RepID=A0A9Q3VBV7_CLOBO|nr:hypothetical protein [Clostridium botulinum]MCD3196154.1 hypothetical protein [Clostridium botulinum C]MCD3201497.1 hypothetical protein [Clostridium botulinum C]MCD3207060.1 hypothetical protein [Clostridium botulinum C]MCD3209634.1 hypothetical protein [Clostridium botulinum C]MCD3226617.1 hypothetical protein [Clostridium botulinum C]